MDLFPSSRVSLMYIRFFPKGMTSRKYFYLSNFTFLEKEKKGEIPLEAFFFFNNFL